MAENSMKSLVFSRWVFPMALWVVAVVVLASCIGIDDRRSSPSGLDLVELFPLAEAYSELSQIRLGSPEVAPLLLEGWGHDHGVDSFAWGMGKRSVLRFYLGRTRDLALRLTGRNFRFENAPRQTVRVEVNGREIDQLVFEDQRDTIQMVKVPQSALVPGFNELTFVYGYSRQPKKVVPGSDDYRPLAMQWDTIEFVNFKDGGRPETHQSGRRSELVLPWHGRVDYFLRINPKTSLIMDGINRWGDVEVSALEVGLWNAGEPNEKVMRIEAPLGRTEPIRLPLEVSETGIVRLSLRVVSDGRAGSLKAGGLRLVNPALKTTGNEVEPSSGSEQRTALLPGSADGKPVNPRRRPNIVLYIIDTLRADHLGCYGYSKPTSPRIDAFANEAVRFVRASAQSAWTKPSIATILTGLYPPIHGANSVSEVLSDEVVTLAELLKDAGYRTAAVVSNSVLSQDYGFDQGFEHFEYLKEKGGREFHQQSDVVNQSVFSWFDQGSVEEPFFLLVHTMDPHAPYTPRSPFLENFAGQVRDTRVGLLPNVNALTWKSRMPQKHTARDLEALYDGEVRFNDTQFGELLDFLKGRGIYDSSVVVLVSDHGEEFGDHGRWQHGFSLYQEMVHVPLIVKFPNGQGAGRVVENVVGQVDIAPTIIDTIGLKKLPAFQGNSLLPSVTPDGVEEGEKPRFSFIRKQRWRDVAAVRLGGRKLIWYRLYDVPRSQVELFDLNCDPQEKQNLVTNEPVLAGYLLTLLKRIELGWGERSLEGESVLSEEMEERLRALGYLQ